jgi:hypothetical protein
MSEKEFKKVTGREPKRDDLERTNCGKAGTPGHFSCGICPVCGQPRFLCLEPMVHEPLRFAGAKALGLF